MFSDMLIVGSINFDILLKQERFPEIGETLQAIDAVTCSGGKGANQAIQIGKLGGNVGFFGAVGNDIFGQVLADSLSENNVDTTLLLNKAGPSGLGVVNHIEGGLLTSTIVKGANFRLDPKDVDDAVASIREASFVVLQNEIPGFITEKAIEIASENDTRVVFNAAPIRPVSDSIFDKVDYLVLNEVEASYYLGQTVNNCEAAIRYGQPFANKHSLGLIITLGPLGSVAMLGTDVWKIAPIDVPVVETTGAGDSYIGALVFRLFRGESLETACQFANCASSITIQAEGALSSMPNLKKVMELYDGVYNKQ